MRQIDDSAGGNRNRHRRREACLESGHGYAIAKNGGAVSGPHGLIAVVGANRVVVGVGVIHERRVADAESAAEDGVGMEPVSKSGTRSEVFVPSLHAQVGGIATNAGQNQGVVGRVVVGETTSNCRSGGRIELPAKAQIDSHLGGCLPFITGEGKDPPLAIAGEEGIEIAACLTGLLHQEAGHVIGNRRSCSIACIRGLYIREGKCASGAEGLILEQIVMNPADVSTPFEGVIAQDFGPVVDKVDIRFGADPRFGRGVTDDRRGETAIESDGHLAAGEALPGDIHSGDAQGGCVVRTKVVGLRTVAEVGYADTHFGQEGRREDVIEIGARAKGLLVAGAFKAAALRSAKESTKSGLLEGDNLLVAVTATHVVLAGQRVVALDVEAVGCFGERKTGGVVVGRVVHRLGGDRSVFGSGSIQLLQDGKRDRILRFDQTVRDLVVHELRTRISRGAGVNDAVRVADRVVDLPLGSIHRAAQVNAPRDIGAPWQAHGWRVKAGVGNGEGAGDGFMIDRVEIVAEEEELVLFDRAAQGASEIVVGKVAQRRGGEIGPSIGGVVLEELEGRTMQLFVPDLRVTLVTAPMARPSSASKLLVEMSTDAMASAGGMMICRRPVRSSSSMPSIW